MVKKTVFLDRDGVINRCAAAHEYICTWDEFEFIPGAKEAIRLLNEAGYRVIVVSNQRAIARAIITMEAMDELHRQMRNALSQEGAYVDAIYICPHENRTCRCRKPDIGLFLQAELKHCIAKTESFMIGDSQTDIQAGKSYGIKTVLIGRGSFGQDMTCDSLLQAAKIIIGEHK